LWLHSHVRKWMKALDEISTLWMLKPNRESQE
jgi:hypothetical protein